jgi:glycosyltransferase involved in cell wall biosynthesis
MSDLRILEIGEHSIFKRAWPDQTDFIYTATDIEQLAHPPVTQPDSKSVRDLRRAIAAHAYDLVVVHAPAYPPWGFTRLRQWLAARRRGWHGIASRSLLPFLVVPGRTPLVVVDMEDQPIIYRHNLRLCDRCAVYFKRELPADHTRLFLRSRAPALPTESERRDATMAARLARLQPISLGLSHERVAAAPGAAHKEVDIFFAGQSIGSSIVRKRGLEELKELARLGYTIDISAAPLSWEEYAARCARAHLVWSPEGLGWDCFRHYEAAACGSVPLISQPTIHRHKPFVEGLHCFYYNIEAGGLVRAARTALKEPDRLRRMAAAGRRHVLRHHTHERICEYIVKISLPGGQHSMHGL